MLYYIRLKETEDYLMLGKGEESWTLDEEDAGMFRQSHIEKVSDQYFTVIAEEVSLGTQEVAKRLIRQEIGVKNSQVINIFRCLVVGILASNSQTSNDKTMEHVRDITHAKEIVFTEEELRDSEIWLYLEVAERNWNGLFEKTLDLFKQHGYEVDRCELEDAIYHDIAMVLNLYIAKKDFIRSSIFSKK